MLKVVIIFLLGTQLVYGQQKPAREWLDQKYSMFIHWGLYSALGGVWDGKPVTNGYSEQIQAHAGIFSDWYAATAQDFMPVGWQADSIVALAKAAGMKSIIFTSKHHDGFCMYHSRYTDYNIVEATPYKRDVMKELAEACRKGGVRFGVYFSLIDWHFPQAYPISSHNADPLTPEHYEYNRKQVEEIMTGYGNISEIWFDMGALTPEQSRGLYRLVDSLQPQCMISGRLGNDCSDFNVMADNEYPDYKIGVPWQTAASFYDETWGYRSWQKRGDVKEKADEKIQSLIKVVSRGGNYLLNIGPKGDGNVVPFEKEVLLRIGRWLQRYGEAIYGAQANPFDAPFEWGDVTQKGDCLYLFVGKGEKATMLRLEGLKGQIEEAAYVGGKKIKSDYLKGSWVLSGLEEQPSEGPVDVIRVKLKPDFLICPVHREIRPEVLSARNAVPVYAYSSMDYYTGFRSTIAYTWQFVTGKKILRPVVCYTANEAGKEIVFTVDGQEETIKLEGGEKRELKTGKIRWGKAYFKPSGSIFGRMPQAEAGNPEENGWRLLPDFRLGERREMPIGERRSVLLLQEIEADEAREIAVEIGSGNGIQVLLNGELLTIHTATRGAVYEKERVLLPLKKGKNRLLLKLYNRFEKKLCFSISPCASEIYEIKLPSRRLPAREWHECKVRLAHPLTKSTAMRLDNIKIKL